MDLTPQLENVTNRAAFEAMIENVGGAPLGALARHRRDAERVLEPLLTAEARAAFLSYADACSDAASQRETAAVRVGLALGVGVGAALAAFPNEAPAAVSSVAGDVVASVIGAAV